MDQGALTFLIDRTILLRWEYQLDPNLELAVMTTYITYVITSILKLEIHIAYSYKNDWLLEAIMEVNLDKNDI